MKSYSIEAFQSTYRGEALSVDDIGAIALIDSTNYGDAIPNYALDHGNKNEYYIFNDDAKDEQGRFVFNSDGDVVNFDKIVIYNKSYDVVSQLKCTYYYTLSRTTLHLTITVSQGINGNFDILAWEVNYNSHNEQKLFEIHPTLNKYTDNLYNTIQNYKENMSNKLSFESIDGMFNGQGTSDINTLYQNSLCNIVYKDQQKDKYNKQLEHAYYFMDRAVRLFSNITPNNYTKVFGEIANFAITMEEYNEHTEYANYFFTQYSQGLILPLSKYGFVLYRYDYTNLTWSVDIIKYPKLDITKYHTKVDYFEYPLYATDDENPKNNGIDEDTGEFIDTNNSKYTFEDIPIYGKYKNVDGKKIQDTKRGLFRRIISFGNKLTLLVDNNNILTSTNLNLDNSYFTRSVSKLYDFRNVIEKNFEELPQINDISIPFFSDDFKTIPLTIYNACNKVNWLPNQISSFTSVVYRYDDNSTVRLPIDYYSNKIYLNYIYDAIQRIIDYCNGTNTNKIIATDLIRAILENVEKQLQEHNNNISIEASNRITQTSRLDFRLLTKAEQDLWLTIQNNSISDASYYNKVNSYNYKAMGANENTYKSLLNYMSLYGSVYDNILLLQEYFEDIDPSTDYTNEIDQLVVDNPNDDKLEKLQTWYKTYNGTNVYYKVTIASKGDNSSFRGESGKYAASIITERQPYSLILKQLTNVKPTDYATDDTKKLLSNLGLTDQYAINFESNDIIWKDKRNVKKDANITVRPWLLAEKLPTTINDYYEKKDDIIIYHNEDHFATKWVEQDNWQNDKTMWDDKHYDWTSTKYEKDTWDQMYDIHIVSNNLATYCTNMVTTDTYSLFDLCINNDNFKLIQSDNGAYYEIAFDMQNNKDEFLYSLSKCLPETSKEIRKCVLGDPTLGDKNTLDNMYVCDNINGMGKVIRNDLLDETYTKVYSITEILDTIGGSGNNDNNVWKDYTFETYIENRDRYTDDKKKHTADIKAGETKKYNSDYVELVVNGDEAKNCTYVANLTYESTDSYYLMSNVLFADDNSDNNYAKLVKLNTFMIQYLGLDYYYDPINMTIKNGQFYYVLTDKISFTLSKINNATIITQEAYIKGMLGYINEILWMFRDNINIEFKICDEGILVVDCDTNSDVNTVYYYKTYLINNNGTRQTVFKYPVPKTFTNLTVDVSNGIMLLYYTINGVSTMKEINIDCSSELTYKGEDKVYVSKFGARALYLADLKLEISND